MSLFHLKKCSNYYLISFKEVFKLFKFRKPLTALRLEKFLKYGYLFIPRNFLKTMLQPEYKKTLIFDRMILFYFRKKLKA